MKYKILIVDDEGFSRDSIRYKIDTNGLGIGTIEEAESGYQALEKIRAREYNIVITDIKMPEMDGLQLIEQGMKISKTIQWIIISGYNEFEYARQGIQFGVCDYLLKPVSHEKLNMALTKGINVVKNQVEDKKEIDLMKNARNQQMLIEKYNDYERLLTHQLSYTDRRNLAKCLEPKRSNVFYQVAVCDINKDATQNTVPYGEVSQLITNSLMDYASTYFYEVILRRGEKIEIIIIYGMNEKRVCLDTYCGYMMHAIHSKLGIETVFGIGSVVKEFNQIYFSYKEALVACQNKILKGYMQVLNIDKIEIKHEQELRVSDIQKDKIIYYLRALKEKELENVIKGMMDELRIKAKNFNQIFEMVLSIHQILESKGGRESGGAVDREFIHTLYHLDSYENIQHILNKNIRKVCDELRYHQDLNGKVIVSKIEKYIQGNTDSSITLEEMAELYHIHPNYLSRIFKKYTGINFNYYIMEVKMKKALIMLNEMDIKITEVSEMLGYKDAKYFSKVFKRYHGVAPSIAQRKVENVKLLPPSS